MIEIRKTDRFASWLDALPDIRARARVQARLDRLAEGNPGDVKPVARVCPSFESTTAQDFESISALEVTRS